MKVALIVQTRQHSCAQLRDYFQNFLFPALFSVLLPFDDKYLQGELMGELWRLEQREIDQDGIDQESPVNMKVKDLLALESFSVQRGP